MKIKSYKHIRIEKKIQNFWYKNNIFKTYIDKNKKKFYCLCMIPYPSGHLHMGHIRNYTIGDIIVRYQRLNQKNILYPIGWDSFGLPAENAAINNNISPKKWTYKNIKYMKNQLKKIGFSYDWKKELITCKSKFYKLEQLLFLILFKNNMIYRKKSIVNWCNIDKTVLANEQVINNKCWRCNNKIKKKNIKQWFIKTTKYALNLYKNIKKLKKWPIKVKKMQKNWIGKFKGYLIKIKIINNNKIIKIFIKKLEYLTATTYILISLTHKIIKNLYYNIFKYSKKDFKIKKLKNEKYYIKKTNLYIIHPITHKNIKILISNIPNIIYNSKIIFFTPICSKKQYKLAKLFKLKIINIFNKLKYLKKKKLNTNIKLINSYLLNNLNIKKAKKKIYKLLNKKIKKIIIFKLKDWVISRQRCWGVPIPILYTKNKYKPIHKNNLPIKLPKKLNININNLNPLKSNIKWQKTKYKNKIAYKETDTIDTFLSTSWYHIKFTSFTNKKVICIKNKANYWLPIDVYIGGIEHATMHLIYLRFIHKFFNKLKLVKYKEPVKKLICQGMVLSKTFYYKNNNIIKWINFKNVIKTFENNKIKYKHIKHNNISLKYYGYKKMSKSLNNGIEPKKIIKKYGADTLRLFIIFSAPIDKNLIWKTKNIIGSYRFLKKLWNITLNFININKNKKNLKTKYNIKQYNKIKFLLHYTIYKVTKYIKKYYFNICISLIMKFIKYFKKYTIIYNIKYLKLYKKCLKNIILLIYPFTPHISFYLWNKLTKKYYNKIDYVNWPKYSNKIIKKFKRLNLIIQINGKKIFIMKIKEQYNKKKIIKKIYKYKNFNKYFKNIKKIIYIKNKVINFII